MKSPARIRPVLWPLRLLQISPLVVFAIAAAVWFAIPAEIRSVALEMGLPGQSATFSTPGFDQPMELAAVSIMDSTVQSQTGRQDVNSTDAMTELRSASDATTGRVMAVAWRLYDSAGHFTPLVLSPDDALFQSLAAYEQASGAHVGAFTIPPVSRPPVALAAVTSLTGLTTSERLEYETSGTLETLRRNVRSGADGSQAARPAGPPGSSAPLQVDVESLSSEKNLVGRKRVVYYATRVVGNRIYEVYSAYPITGDIADPGSAPMLADTAKVDSPGNRRDLEHLARLTGGAAFVVGPTDASLVAVRAPTGMRADAVEGLVGSVVTTLGLGQETGVRRTDPKAAKLAGAGPWTATALSFTPGFESTSPSGQTGAIAPMLYVAFWQTHPEIPIVWNRLGRTPLREFQVWLAGRSAPILGGLALCFAVSLVASPLAFARERALTAERDLERERERVRKQARERVVSRLTELSERIDLASNSASGSKADEITAAARDIDATVAELKAILGDLTSVEGGGDA